MNDSQRIEAFIDKYSPEIASRAHELRGAMHQLLPRGFELVYDNYNALALGYGPTLKTADAIFSLAIYPRWVLLFFLRGATLDDPHKLLQGDGNRVRHIKIKTVEELAEPRLRELMQRAVASSRAAWDSASALKCVVKSVSDQQRPRR